MELAGLDWLMWTLGLVLLLGVQAWERATFGPGVCGAWHNRVTLAEVRLLRMFLFFTLGGAMNLIAIAPGLFGRAPSISMMVHGNFPPG